VSRILLYLLCADPYSPLQEPGPGQMSTYRKFRQNSYLEQSPRSHEWLATFVFIVVDLLTRFNHAYYYNIDDGTAHDDSGAAIDEV
jgi:hypothetical protein